MTFVFFCYKNIIFDDFITINDLFIYTKYFEISFALHNISFF